jgi:hypothetical protein
MKTKHEKHAHHNQLHFAKRVLETSLQVFALASLVHRVGPRRAARVAAVATRAYLKGRA